MAVSKTQGRSKLRRYLATEPPLYDETTPEGAAELAAMEFVDPEYTEVRPGPTRLVQLLGLSSSVSLCSL